MQRGFLTLKKVGNVSNQSLSSSSPINLLLVGCGKVGGSLLKSWVSNEFLNRIVVIQPSLSKKHEFEVDKINKKVEFISSEENLPSYFKPDIMALAIKPQNLKDMSETFFLYCEKSLVVSFLAGITIDVFKSYAEKVWKTERAGKAAKAKKDEKRDFRMIRIMPNMALRIGRSVNLAYADASSISQNERQSIAKLFSSLGEVMWLSNEESMDILTPFSASGLAYFFLMAEVLTQKAMKLGISKDVSRVLIQKTLLGSALLASQTHDFEELIDQVASRGGVTEAALEVLRPLLPEIMEKSIQAALKRLKDLSF